MNSLGSKRQRTEDAIHAGEILALNIIHFVQSKGIGPNFLVDALQSFENAKARFYGHVEGFQFSPDLLADTREAAATLKASKSQE